MSEPEQSSTVGTVEQPFFFPYDDDPDESLSGETERSVPTGRGRWSKAFLAAGFVALAIGIAAAYTHPMTGYELSIYRATPFLFWFCMAFSISSTLIVSFVFVPKDHLRTLALVLAGTAICTIAALPIIRGYYFFGGADSLTHLGWVREISRGTLNPLNFLYPTLHTLSVFFGVIVGVPFRLSIQYVVLAFVPVYLLFVPLCVRELSAHPWAVPVGVFSSLLLLPLNDISVFYMAYPTTQALFVAPLVFYVLINYLRTPTDSRWQVTGAGVLLALVSSGIVLVHPEQALNVLLVFGSIAAFQIVSRFVERRPFAAAATQRPVYVQTVFLAGVFLVWTSRNGRARNVGASIVYSLLHGAAVGNEVSQHGLSLTAIGASVVELFLKLFSVGLVFALIVGFFALASVAGRGDSVFSDRNATNKGFCVALVVLLGLFVALFASSHTVLYFRQLGFVMVLVTILGAVAIAWAIDGLETHVPSKRVLTAVGLCFAVLLAASVPIFFFSPYIYQPSSGVTHAEMSGYRTAFEHRAPGVPFTGVRASSQRAIDAIYGPDSPEASRIPGREAVVPGPVFDNNLTTHYRQDRYLVVTRENVETAFKLYDGFRYSKQGFHSVAHSRGIDLVESTGGFRLYLVRRNPNATANSDTIARNGRN